MKPFFFCLLADPIDIRKLVRIQNYIKREKKTVQETPTVALQRGVDELGDAAGIQGRGHEKSKKDKNENAVIR